VCCSVYNIAAFYGDKVIATTHITVWCIKILFTERHECCDKRPGYANSRLVFMMIDSFVG